MVFPHGSFRAFAKRSGDFLDRFARDESAATAIEYGLIVAGISIAILATVFAIGEELNGMFEFIGSKILERSFS